MKIFFIVCALILSGTISNAQNKIKGRIIDQDSLPLVGAYVAIPEISKRVATDQNGYYELANLPNGKMKVQFTFLGHTSKIESIVFTGSDIIFNAKLRASVFECEEIVVTGGYSSTQHENAVKIEVLKLNSFSSKTTPNFTEILTKIPGIDMISKGNGVSKPVIRGLSMNDILVMNNGIRIENYQFSENHPLGVDDNDVERVEVIKGPASLLYGSDAIGGVLNFIKEQPAPTGKIMGDYKMQLHSNTLGMNNSLGIKGASKFFFSGLRVSNKTHADYKQGGGDFVPNSRFNEWSLGANTGYTGKIGTFKVFYDYFKQELGMTVPPVKQLITKQGRKNKIWYQDLEHHMVSSQNKLYLGKFKWEANLGYQIAMRKLQTTLEVPAVEMNLNTFTYESKVYLPSSKTAEYILGIQGVIQTNRNQNDRASQFLPDADVNTIGGLALAQYSFFGKLKLQGGLRFDANKTETFALGTVGTEGYHAPVSRKFSSLNGSVGATYSVNEKLLLRMNLAKAYRVPNLSELTSNGVHGNRYEIGNENLNPENAYESDASLHYHGEYLSFDLAGFYNHIDNYIFISPTAETTSSGMEIYRFKQTNSKLYGGEAGVHFHPKSIPWLHVQGNYSMVTGKQENGNYLPFIPAQKFLYEIRAEKETLAFLKHPNIWLSALTALKQVKPSTYETETDGYTLVNAGINTEIKISNQNLNIGLSVNNIFDEKYIDHLSTLKEVNLFNPGRNFALSVKVPFTYAF